MGIFVDYKLYRVILIQTDEWVYKLNTYKHGKCTCDIKVVIKTRACDKPGITSPK